MSLRAATRDASVLHSPGVAERYHVVVDGLPACNRTEVWRKGAMPLVDDRSRPVDEIPTGLRCRRPGCARLWPVDSKAKETPK